MRVIDALHAKTAWYIRAYTLPLTLKVPEKLQLYGLYVYYVHGAHFRLWHVKS